MTAGERALLEAGPGHVAYTYRWRKRNGIGAGVTFVLPDDATNTEAHEVARQNGWPGHNGAWWRYIKDDLIAWWLRNNDPL